MSSRDDKWFYKLAAWLLLATAAAKLYGAGGSATGRMTEFFASLISTRLQHGGLWLQERI